MPYEDIFFTHCEYTWVYWIQLIGGLKLICTARSDSTVVKTIVIQNIFEFLMASSIELFNVGELVFYALQVSPPSSIILFTLPKYVYRGGSASFALWVRATIMLQ